MNDAPHAAAHAWERRTVQGLALAAGLRAALLAATFPFFTNVDEHRHVDMVLKYARGYLPRPGDAAYEPEIGGLVARLGSPEYLLPRGRGVPPPLRQMGERERAQRIAANERFFRGGPNLETFQSPAYYATAGLWLAVLRAVGLETAVALFAVRALGALSIAGLVLVAGALLRRTHAGAGEAARLVRLGVPALLAAAPLDVVGYVTGDSLSTLTGGLAFAGLAWLLVVREVRLRSFAGVGAALALAVLTKTTNVVLVGVAAGVAASRLRVQRATALRREAAGVAALGLAFALPLGAWMLRSAALTGSAFGTAQKVAGLGWGLRPLADWPAHPILGFPGAGIFLAELVPIFWRGEVAWHRVVLGLPWADAFYTASSALLLGLAVAGLRQAARARERRVEAAALLSVAGAVAVLVLLSLRFTFTATSNPSAEHPYFVQGRLVSGVWLPFALLYVRGIAVGCGALPARWRGPAGWGALGVAIAVCLVSELWLALPVFGSAYNAFHRP